MFWKTCNKERTGVDKKSIKARVPAGTRSPFAGRRQVPSFPPAAILFFSPFWQDAATLTFAHTQTPATSTGCVVISERTSLWREGPNNRKIPPAASPGCMLQQRRSTCGGNFEWLKAAKSAAAHSRLGIEHFGHIQLWQFPAEFLQTLLIPLVCGLVFTKCRTSEWHWKKHWS